ncbi:Uncharacterised protein [Finegoldia magna]|uniref:Uncharacterized protein n=1 Tax=Finegoldia magna TaxID=1260 RepID=A0A6N3C6Y7_FINMA
MAPGVAVPVTVVSKDFGWLIFGASVISTTGFLPAVAMPSFDLFPALSFAIAVTSVSSFTLSAGIVTIPVAGSTVRPDPSGALHVPSSPFVTTTVSSVSLPSGV